jgi:hypothetical protein
MATAGVRPVVEQVCDEQVHNGGMFTAHDITLEVRNRGHRVGHHEVRDAVHDYFARGGMGVAYTRTTISVPAGGTPFLYHRTADDPATYGNIRGVGLVPNPSVNTISVPPPSSIASTDDDEEDDEEDEDDEDDDVVDPSALGLPNSVAGVAVASRPKTHHKSKSANKNKLVGRTVDGRATLSLPSPLVRAAGFNPGDKVYATGVPDGVEVTLHPTSAALCRKYTVDNHGHIRLTQGLLKRAGIPGGAYDVSGDNTKITVKLHK